LFGNRVDRADGEIHIRHDYLTRNPYHFSLDIAVRPLDRRTGVDVALHFGRAIIVEWALLVASVALGLAAIVIGVATSSDSSIVGVAVFWIPFGILAIAGQLARAWTTRQARRFIADFGEASQLIDAQLESTH